MIQCEFQKKLQAPHGEMLLDVKFTIEKGAFVVIYGESGAGKTSILRMMAGFLSPEKGKMKVAAETWLNTKEKQFLEPQKRKIGFVFQDYALFPNMSVEENLNFASADKNNKSHLEELISIMELHGLRDRKPATLSGGQQQRVALARALVRKPEILLLDEPLSALDHGIRGKLQDYILKVHRQFGLTTILISHDPGEIIKLADKVLVLENGQITKEEKPVEIFTKSKLSGKFQFSGEVMEIKPEGVVTILSILIGRNVIKVVCMQKEVSNIKAGDQVLVASKAFNPVVRKIE
ncbi:ATP-binding cassette domain-containing protein [Autumnicola musiva]|uniref:ATP-binding cassette domain-containing protein n=1 Tax=Autumnicola musiva TaxID=3075589 RepID=A0ABU3D6W8_9FLAO|nr:ATP-binding cassette domain-containing protein [Zunongwangia sp. F117]MDT0677281.1 ATP-binding cassette domain-containing protein [Zunongwangia sp. F117]